MRRLMISLMAAVLVAGVSWGIPQAAADEPDHVVQAGAVHPDKVAPYEFTNYYPNDIRVHRGETVEFRLDGFHSVTFHASGTNERVPFLRPDELPGDFALSEAWAFHTGCGRAGLAPCVVDGSPRFVSSGPAAIDTSPFRVTFDAPSGVYRFNCTVHPTMQGQVQVVPDEASVPTAEETQELRRQQIAADAATADLRVDSTQETVSSVEGGRRVWEVLLGDSTPDNHVAILSYPQLPTQIAPGDTIRFSFRPGVVDEPHTVTFPKAASEGTRAAAPDVPAGLAGLAFHPSCDLDSPTSGAPGIPGPWVPDVMNCPGNLELKMSPWLLHKVSAPGDMVLTPATVHDSALLLSPELTDADRRIPGEPARYHRSTFEAIFPNAGEFTFACNVHGSAMQGTVRVA